MMQSPNTTEQARAYRYGAWSGNPSGDVYQKSQCAYEVVNGWLFRQCRMKPGHGPGGLYCKRHAKKVTP